MQSITDNKGLYKCHIKWTHDVGLSITSNNMSMPVGQTNNRRMQQGGDVKLRKTTNILVLISL